MTSGRDGDSPVPSMETHRHMSLATFRRSGAEVRTPVWFGVADGKLYVFTASDSGKVKRLLHTSRVRVAPCRVRGQVEGAWRDGTARVVTDARLLDRARAALSAKYGWQMWLLDLFSWLAGRIHRRAWIEISIPFERRAERSAVPTRDT